MAAAVVVPVDSVLAPAYPLLLAPTTRLPLEVVEVVLHLPLALLRVIIPYSAPLLPMVAAVVGHTATLQTLE
jgi:hypothetical protein